MGSLIKQCIFFKIVLKFSLPRQIQIWNSERILTTHVQHFLWGEVRGWARVNWKTPKKCKSVSRLLSMIVGLLLFITDAPIFRESFFIMQPLLTSTRTNSQFFWNLLCKWHVMCNAFCHILALQGLPKKICCSTAAIIVRSTELNLGCFLTLETIVD